MKAFFGSVFILTTLATAPALALGGSASGPDSGLSAHVVMVLSREGNRHGSCTGTVIAPTIILTAAHCVAGRKQVAIAYKEDGSHVLQRVSTRALHPGFSAKAKVSIDLALVRLDTPLPPRFRPVRLDRGEGAHAIGVTKTVAGFGIAQDGIEASAGTLRSARVPILPQLYARFLRLGPGPGSNLDVFAICTGDSGGPVFASGEAGPLVVGVIYGREKFGNAASCGIIAQAVRIAPQRQWLDGVLARWGAQAAAQ